MNINELKIQLPKGRAILAFDYGEKRLGIAVSDLLLMTANPVGIIQRSTFDKDVAQIKQIIAEKEVGALVYGMPLQMDGTEGETAASVRKFAEQIAKSRSLIHQRQFSFPQTRFAFIYQHNLASPRIMLFKIKK